MIVEEVEGIETYNSESEPEKEVHNDLDQMKLLEFNTQEYFSHVLQADLITDLTTCKSNVEDLTHKIQFLVQLLSNIFNHPFQFLKPNIFIQKKLIHTHNNSST